MSRSGNPVRIDAVPFGPETMWLLDPQHMGSRKIRRRYHEIMDTIEKPVWVPLVMAALPTDDDMSLHVAAPLALELKDVKAAAMLAGVVSLQNPRDMAPPWVEPAVRLAVISLAMDAYPVEQRRGYLLEWLVRVFFVAGVQGGSRWDESWPFIDECIGLALPAPESAEVSSVPNSSFQVPRPRPKVRH